MARVKHSFAGPEAAAVKAMVAQVSAPLDIRLPSTVEVRADGNNGLPAIFLRTPDGGEFEAPISNAKAVRMAYELLQLASTRIANLLIPINALRTVLLALKA